MDPKAFFAHSGPEYQPWLDFSKAFRLKTTKTDIYVESTNVPVSLTTRGGCYRVGGNFTQKKICFLVSVFCIMDNIMQ